jgi:hypothetical protein
VAIGKSPAVARVEQLGPWPARALWVLLALLAPATVADALAGRSAGVQLTVAVLCWAGWSVGLVALLVPRTASLTVVRLVVPAGAAVTAVAAATGSDATMRDGAAVLAGVLTALAAALPWVAEAFVDGSSYGPERRIPLRPPPAVLALAALTRLAVVAGIATGPLLLAARQWALGAAATVAGAGLAWLGARSLHQLARRFLVVVPAGLVVQDPLSMPEAQLFPRHTIRHLGPALRGDPAATGGSPLDLTAGATGLAVELVLEEPVELLVRTGRASTEPRTATTVLCTPLRPTVLFEAARQRRMPVG